MYRIAKCTTLYTGQAVGEGGGGGPRGQGSGMLPQANLDFYI